jgi:ELP3 family radical SAM enzyme/protein acetyltransferase
MQPITTASYDIIIQLLALDHPTMDDLLSIRKSVSQAHGLAHMPGNAEIIKSYYELIQAHKQWVADNPNDSDYTLFTRRKDVEAILKKRAVRSQSGIVPVQVLTKPFWCPGECIFCPNDATMPKSYINTEPGAQRALLNNFDPYKQVFNRLLSLTLTGHETDKIEMIVLWGTRDVYPKEYKISFIKGLYDACNAFEQFFEWYISWTIKLDSTKSVEYESLGIVFPQTISESLKINETAWCRIIWLTLETRPEYVTDENCQFWRSIGVTRIEMGIQSMFDDVLDANKRGHNNEQCKQAMFRLRQYGFKISIHLMPGLYKSTTQKDIDTFRIAFQDPAFCPDELKFYPTAVIPNTELFNLYAKGEFKPLSLEENKHIIKTVLKNYIPPYTRIKRLIRDIPAEETVGSHYVTNLRQLVENELEQEIKNKDVETRKEYYRKMYGDLMEVEDNDELLKEILSYKEKNREQETGNGERELKTFIPKGVKLNLSDYRNFVCFDTRSREIRTAKPVDSDNIRLELFPIIRSYPTTNGLQLFISFEDNLGYLYGFIRLQLGDIASNLHREGLGAHTALVRELHIYGQLNSIGNTDKEKTQHKGLGWQLMDIAEKIAWYCGYNNLSVISGVGVRKYYEKLWYTLEWSYMTRNLLQ